MVAIVTLSELKTHLNMSSTTEDVELLGVLDAAEVAVERHLGQVVTPRTVVEDHYVGAPTNPDRRVASLALRTGPVVSVTSVTSVDGGVVWDPSVLLLDSAAGFVTSWYGPALWGHVRVTYTAGLDPVPPNIRLATLIIAAHLWETQRPASFSAPSFGREDTPFAAAASAGYALPNRALELLGGRPPVIA